MKIAVSCFEFEMCANALIWRPFLEMTALSIFQREGIWMYRSAPVVSPEDIRLEFIIESPQLIRINYPAINIGFKLFEQVRVEFEKVPRPWQYDCMFNMLPFQGHILFDELDAFRESWYRMVGDRDIGRKVASVSVDPLTAERFETYKVLFPTRVFRLFHTVAEAYAWLGTD